ncbi:VOC family protein [Leptobacterium flavescens]|uniref:VOC family protein n=1 Tax=Leptobacterium flavescens TaxID=472055 RepID=A0A6P0UM47_9FLAO|nr:VOC family protein [Leptobacterium flavescens]NER13642.1 VOC family protein [Leptobacterium flavescens]
MNSIAPSGYSRVCPYLMIDSVEDQLHFLLNIFECELLEEVKNKQDQVQHAEIRIGDVVIMMGRARKEWPARTNMLYVFVSDVDKVYNRALEYKGKSIAEPVLQGYGFKEAGIEDPQGNQWWIAQPEGHTGNSSKK